MNRIRKIAYLLGVIPKLGFGNVAFMFWYRFSLKTGLRKRMFPVAQFEQSEPFFASTHSINQYPDAWKAALKKRADGLVSGKLTWFSKHQFQVGNLPNWFINPFTGVELKHNTMHWTAMSDFDLNTGDVKILWEPSRFDWVTDLARAYRVFCETIYLDTLNAWLSDWMSKNPVNQGVNWKCGQETSIRIMKLMTALHILQQWENPSKAVLEALHHHLIRVTGNVGYAIAQDNNHGTSEAAAMYIAGGYLYKQTKKKRYRDLSSSGKSLFENRILKLVGNDGTFSQESVTYHRVVCDTVSWVLWAQELLSLAAFPDIVQQRFKALLEWQFSFTIPQTGDMPNIGSNDGAMFENLHCNDYRDFRPSSQLLCYALHKKVLYDSNETWHEPVFWRYGALSLIERHQIPLKSGRIFDNSFVLLQNSKARVIVKVPNNRFRPANNPFHLDLWVNGTDVFRGSGSYSYNHETTSYYKSIASCNTVQFGTNEPMPKLSRFLNGAWIKADLCRLEDNQDGSISWTGKYTDYRGNTHKRSIILKSNLLEVIDSCSGDDKATLRWHAPEFTNDKVLGIKLEISKSIISVSDSSRSLYYMLKEEQKTIASIVSNEIKTTVHF